MQVAESHWTVWWSRLQTVRTLRSGAAPEGESVADTSDWCSKWSRSPQNSWNEEEKSNQKHDTCGAGEQDEREQQDGWAEEPVTVTMRVTASRGAERGHRRSAATTRAKLDGEREVEAEKQCGRVQGDDQHCTTGCEPLVVWKHGVREKGALGEKVERQLHVPCDKP